jgi:hypothetical protein
VCRMLLGDGRSRKGLGGEMGRMGEKSKEEERRVEEGRRQLVRGSVGGRWGSE